MKKIKIRKGDLIFIVIIVFMLGFVFGVSLIAQINKEIPREPKIEGEKIVEMGLPAVDNNGRGVTARLVTTVRPGTGLILVNINNVLAQYDTQYSGRVAAKVAGDYTNTDMSKLDVIYNIKTNATLIEGPSAGATMSLSIILAVKNISGNSSIMMTGTINEDGTIGPVGAIYQKAGAAKDVGATLFLVPVNKSVEYMYQRERKCQKIEFIEYCTINYIPKEVNIGKDLNMTVIEVKNIEEALFYFK